MASEQLMSPASGGGGGGGRYFQMQPEQIPSMVSSLFSFAPAPTQEANRIFEELPKAVIVSVSRPDASDISPVLLSYTIECQYKQASSSESNFNYKDFKYMSIIDPSRNYIRYSIVETVLAPVER